MLIPTFEYIYYRRGFRLCAHVILRLQRHKDSCPEKNTLDSPEFT